MKTAIAISAALLLSACASQLPTSNTNRDYAMSSFSTVNSHIAIPGQYTSPHSF